MKMMKFSEQGTQRQAELNYKKPPVNHDQYYWLSFADRETSTNDCDNFLLAKKHAVRSATVEVLGEEWELYVPVVYCIPSEVYAPGDVGFTGKEVQDSGNHQIKVEGGKLFRFEYGFCM